MLVRRKNKLKSKLTWRIHTTVSSANGDWDLFSPEIFLDCYWISSRCFSGTGCWFDPFSVHTNTFKYILDLNLHLKKGWFFLKHVEYFECLHSQVYV